MLNWFLQMVCLIELLNVLFYRAQFYQDLILVYSLAYTTCCTQCTSNTHPIFILITLAIKYGSVHTHNGKNLLHDTNQPFAFHILQPSCIKMWDFAKRYLSHLKIDFLLWLHCQGTQFQKLIFVFCCLNLKQILHIVLDITSCYVCY